MKINKPELVRKVAERTGLKTIEAQVAVDTIFEMIQEALSHDEKVQIVDFGSFEVRDRTERMGRNPATGETIVIPSVSVPTFKPGKGFKDAVRSVSRE